MKQTGYYIAALLFALLLVTACNKYEERAKAASIQVNGYNSTGEPLIMEIDTTLYKSGEGRTYPNKKQIKNTILHPYYSSDEAVFTLTGEKTGKVYLRQQLDKNKLDQRVTFTWVDGKNVFDPPAADENTNKIGIFIANPLQQDAIDVKFYYTTYNPEDGTSTKGKPHYIENVQPWKWVYVDYKVPDKIEGKLGRAHFEFYKTGTTEWAFGKEHLSKADMSLYKENPDSFIYFPSEGETGNVYSYILAVDVTIRDGKEEISQTPFLYPRR